MGCVCATWNVNGIKSRIDSVVSWLESRQPDIACLQEIKSVDENFPAEPIEALGYHVATHGQKSFNGVALLSKHPLEDIQTGLPGDESDEQARFISARISLPFGSLRVASLYLPNGNPVDSEKYPYKLKWMDRFERLASEWLQDEEPVLLMGDYNIIPQAEDARRPDEWREDALFRVDSRTAFRRILGLGLTEAYRSVSDDVAYSFWDYQAGAWQKNNGIRIDHALASPEASDRIESCWIDQDVRGWEKPSDHVPLMVNIRTAA